MLLSELLKGIDTKSNFNDTEITDITDNTAKLCEGCVFVCIKGAHFDGHSAAEEAVNRFWLRTQEMHILYCAPIFTVIRPRSFIL